MRRPGMGRQGASVLAGTYPVAATFTPADLNPEGWWRADLGHSLSDTDPVTSWKNTGSEAGGDLSQGTAALQPTYDASHASFNGQAVIDYDGGDVLFAAAGTWWHLAADNSDMVLVAIARCTTAATQESLVQTRQLGSQGGIQLRWGTGGQSTRCYIEESGGVVQLIDSGSAGTQNSVHCLAGVLTGATAPSADSLECWLDGASTGATTANLGVIAAAANREWCIGGTSTTVGTFTGQVAEILYVKRLLTAQEDSDLTGYINTRYGLSLPGVTQ